MLVEFVHRNVVAADLRSPLGINLSRMSMPGRVQRLDPTRSNPHAGRSQSSQARVNPCSTEPRPPGMPTQPHPLGVGGVNAVRRRTVSICLATKGESSVWPALQQAGGLPFRRRLRRTHRPSTNAAKLSLPIRGPLGGPKPCPPARLLGPLWRNRVPEGGCHVPIAPAPATFASRRRIYYGLWCWFIRQ